MDLLDNSTKKFVSDVDIDFADRQQALSLLDVVPASITTQHGIRAHNTGVYPTDIPIDPFTGIASMDYVQAQARGYVKLDFLNVNVYSQVKSNEHLLELMNREPEWHRLYDQDFCAKLVHIGNHYGTLIGMPEAVNSIPRMAMFLSVIRPAKRHLIGRTWAEVGREVWTSTETGYAFKRSHAVAYAHLVCVHMNLLVEQAEQSSQAF